MNKKIENSTSGVFKPATIMHECFYPGLSVCYLFKSLQSLCPLRMHRSCSHQTWSPTIWYAKHIVQFENMQSEQKRLQSVVWGGRSRVEGTNPLLSYWDLGSCGGESQGQSWGFWRSKQLSSALIPFTSRRRAHTLLFHTFGGFIFNLVSQPVCSSVMLLWSVSLCPCSLLTGGEVLMNIQRGRAVFSLQDARLGALSPRLPT